MVKSARGGEAAGSEFYSATDPFATVNAATVKGL